MDDRKLIANRLTDSDSVAESSEIRHEYLETVIKDILAGEYTEAQVGRLQDAIRNRRLIEGLSILEGDRVMVRDTAKPLYLRGATGTIVGRSGERLLVQFDNDMSDPRVRGRRWRIRPTSLEKSSLA